MYFIYFIFNTFISTYYVYSDNINKTVSFNNYCIHPDCSLKNQHTMCVTANKQSPRLYTSGMTTWMRYQILLLHNRHRDNIAMGLEPGQPSAANMRKMYWDYELEEMAQAWARQCQKRHDECRNTIRFNVLQNMDVRPVLSKVTEAQLLADAVGAWFSGSRVLPPENVWSFKRSNCSASGGCNDHWYSAAAWASTWRLGCSQALCTAKVRSCVLFRNRRKTKCFQKSKEVTQNDTVTRISSSNENILRRKRYITSSKYPLLKSFAIAEKKQIKESLNRGLSDNVMNFKKRKEPTIIAFTFCNYGPAGNIDGFPIYQAGATCTNCPQGTRCGDRTHRGLCSVLGDPDIQ